LNSTSGAFLDGKLPLTVLSVLPSLEDNDEPNYISGKTALQVLFSRPVIALGQDYLEIPPEKIPFYLIDKDSNPIKVPGKFRYPTTYIARFDPDINWPSDLDFGLLLNANLTAHDGVLLSDSENTFVKYKTNSMALWISSVTSEKAMELTGDRWSAYTSPIQDTVPECPPDGRITVQFTNPIDLALIEDVAFITPKTSYTIEPCKHDQHCLIITDLDLEVDTVYTFTVPKGSTYHALSGPSRVKNEMKISGLVSFKFPFFESIGNIQYTRYDIWLRHGLLQV